VSDAAIEIRERLVLERIDEMHARDTDQLFPHRSIDVRIPVHRIDEIHVGVALREVAQRTDDLEERSTKFSPAMRGDQDEALSSQRKLGRALGLLLHDLEERVDHRVPVTVMAVGSTPSRRRFARAPSVGAKWCDAMTVVTRRFTSPDTGTCCHRCGDPASTCATGMRA
jgi:hypothetical protein